MTTRTPSQSEKYSINAGWIVASLIIVATVAFLYYHERLPDMPPVLPDHVKAAGDIAAQAASAEALRDSVGLVVTLSIGLAAVVGFAVKDSVGTDMVRRCLNSILLSLFVYFLARIILYAREAYGAIAVELDRGYLFITRIEHLMNLEARSLVWAALIAVTILGLKLSRS